MAKREEQPRSCSCSQCRPQPRPQEVKKAKLGTTPKRGGGPRVAPGGGCVPALPFSPFSPFSAFSGFSASSGFSAFSPFLRFLRALRVRRCAPPLHHPHPGARHSPPPPPPAPGGIAPCPPGACRPALRGARARARAEGGSHGAAVARGAGAEPAGVPRAARPGPPRSSARGVACGVAPRGGRGAGADPGACGPGVQVEDLLLSNPENEEYREIHTSLVEVRACRESAAASLCAWQASAASAVQACGGLVSAR